jgi:glycerol dehydrogenase
MKIFGAPNRYVQGSGILDQIGEILSPVGDRFFIFGDEVVLSITRDRVVSALERSNKIPITEVFQGECSYKEISRLKRKA